MYSFKLPNVLNTNATLYFKQYTGETELDPATNNHKPVFTTIEIPAVITELGDRVQENDQAGGNLFNRKVRGYLKKPLPDGVEANNRIDCSIDTSTRKEFGTLYITERMTPFRREIIKQTGIPIQGTFQTTSGGT